MSTHLQVVDPANERYDIMILPVSVSFSAIHSLWEADGKCVVTSSRQ
jgi:hypothetical protein